MGTNSPQTIHKFHEGTNSVSNGNELIISTNMSTINIELSGNATGSTLNFEVLSIDGGSWYGIQGVNLTAMTLASSVTTLGSIYQFDLTGSYKFRIRVSEIISGTVNAIGRVVN